MTVHIAEGGVVPHSGELILWDVGERIVPIKQPRKKRARGKQGFKHLTEKQRTLLEFVGQYVYDHGYPPSLREIGDALELTALSSVVNHVKKLCELGFIEYTPRTPRSVRLAGTWEGSKPELIPTLLARIDKIVWYDATTKVDLRSAKEIREGLVQMAVDFNWQDADKH